MRKRTTLRGLTALVGTVALATPLAYVSTATAAAPASRHTIVNTLPGWAVPSHIVGSPAASSRLTVDVQLAVRDAAALTRLAGAVSDPASSQYRKYLTTAQFNARFAPTTAAVAAVEAYLRSQGLAIGAVPSNRRYVEVSGTVSQVQRAFATTLHTYSVNGKSVVGPDVALSVPTSIAGDVLTVTGLGDDLATPDHETVAPSGVTPGIKVPPPSTCSDYWAQNTQRVPKAYGRKNFPTYICGYTPVQFQKAYGIKHTIVLGQDGSGTKVAIVDAYASPTIEADANQLFTNVDSPTFTQGQFQQQQFPPFNRLKACGGKAGWAGEETLDVEAVHATAPGADQLYVGAQNCGAGLDHAINWIIGNVDDPNSSAFGVTMISNSYGIAGEGQSANRIAAELAIFTQAAVEGIGVYFSSGDSGDESTLGHTTTPQPDIPASYPYVTAVGGTSLEVTQQNNVRLETGWGTDLDSVNVDGQGNEHGYVDALPGAFRYGAGGGTSTLFNEPWYQKGIVPKALAEKFDGTRNRVVPDVGMDADPYTGMLEGITVDGTYTQYPIGGTSLACPLFVGMQATAQGKGDIIGFANPVLYKLPAGAFHDIMPPSSPAGVTNTTGSYLVTLDQDSSLATAKGYDNVTGRGSPNGVSFLTSEREAVNHP